MAEDILRDMRRRCRLAMNGVVSTSMRQKGLAYKTNFGLTIQQIKDLATNYMPDKVLAEKLWQQDTRELRILATLLYPLSEFDKERAEEWITGVSNQEIREQISMNLFQNLPYAPDLVTEWGNKDEETRTTAYWLLARLLITKKITGFAIDNLPFIWMDINADNTFLRNASLLAMKCIGRQSVQSAQVILGKIAGYENSDSLLEREIYDSLFFEFGYYMPEK